MPYHLARYRELGKSGWDVRIIQVANRHELYFLNGPEMDEALEIRTLFRESLENLSPRRASQAVVAALEQIDPDIVVVVGYADLSMRAAAKWSRKRSRTCVMVTDTWEGDKKRHFLTEAWKKRWCRRMYDALFLSGSRSMQYFQKLGVPSEKIWCGVDVVDNAHFSRGADEARAEGPRLRAALGLPGSYFLTVARHSPEKNLGVLLGAFQKYQEAGGTNGLVLAGDGPLRPALEARARILGLQNVRFLGWLPYDTLPKYYGLAAAFILPSISEPWGLAVNEAMAAGLPVALSKMCGCLPELCRTGDNGFVFNPLDEDGLGRLMLAMSSEEHDLGRMGRRSGAIIADFTPESWARNLLDCLNRVGGVVHP
ncbi:MAG TPA: glycosyltransferase family 4 protein [Candidatus Aminicenantes bacterium]|nr:glycosyltransferase family 4 protein [Candidatus Aminicenantes bacterium]